MKRIAIICTILILISCSVFAKTAGDKCYALALEGGGDKAAYQIGAIAQIVEDSDPAEVQYDVISGVSLGAINAALLAGFPKGQERNATDNALKIWREITQSDIYKEWSWGGIVRGLLHETSLYDSSPFGGYIRKELSSPLRGLLVSATNAETGVSKTWDETTEWTTLLRAIDASSAFPGFFAPVQDLDNTTYYDGSTSYAVDIFGAINKCVDMGYDYSQIVIDVILCSGATFNVEDVSEYRTIPMLLRYLEIERFYDTMELLERAMNDFKGVDFRHVVAPTSKLEPGLIPLVFSHEEIEKMISKGREDAKQAMQFESGKSSAYILEYTQKKLYESYSENYVDFLKSKSS